MNSGHGVCRVAAVWGSPQEFIPNAMGQHQAAKLVRDNGSIAMLCLLGAQRR